MLRCETERDMCISECLHVPYSAAVGYIATIGCVVVVLWFNLCDILLVIPTSVVKPVTPYKQPTGDPVSWLTSLYSIDSSLLCITSRQQIFGRTLVVPLMRVEVLALWHGHACTPSQVSPL